MDRNFFYQKRAEEHQHEVSKELATRHMLKESGLSGANLLARAANALRNLMKARSNRLQDHHSIKHQSYQS